MKSDPQRTLVLATHNQGKIREFKDLLGDGWKVCTASDLTPRPDWIENGTTFEENARIKAEAVRKVAGGVWVLGEDSGICIDFLQGAPGIYSGRFRDEKGGTDACNNFVINELTSAKGDERKAHFISVLFFVDESGAEKVFEGYCHGHIAYKSAGENGFDYDKIFVPEGHTKTVAEMDPAEKNALSHRNKAVRSFASGLNS